MTTRDRMIAAARLLCDTGTRVLNELGEISPLLQANIDLQTAARRVVWCNHQRGPDASKLLKKAIGELEDLVGRPKKESE